MSTTRQIGSADFVGPEDQLQFNLTWGTILPDVAETVDNGTITAALIRARFNVLYVDSKRELFSAPAALVIVKVPERMSAGEAGRLASHELAQQHWSIWSVMSDNYAIVSGTIQPPKDPISTIPSAVKYASVAIIVVIGAILLFRTGVVK